jgi:SAM-dependent methyltransferase
MLRIVRRIINRIIRAFIFLIKREINPEVITGNGERFDPELTAWKDPNHLKRYEFALEFVKKGDIVIDIACGTGYGTKILARRAHKVYGVDISKIAIQYAKKKYKLKNTVYLIKNFWNFSTKGDVIVSFETVEHIQDCDGVNEIFRKLLELSNRYVIASFPYKEVVGNNPHHVHFNLDETTLKLKNLNSKKYYYQKSDGNIFSEKEKNHVYQNLIIFVAK